MKRFGNAEKLAACWGLAPSHQSSGEMHKHRHMTKTGSAWLRHAMVEATRTTVRRGARIEGIERTEKRHGKLKATAAAARHMLEITWHMTVNKEPYRSQDEDLTARKPKSRGRNAAT